MAKPATVKVAMQANQPGQPGWPHPDYNYEQKAAEVLRVLKGRLPDINFDFYLYTDPSQARDDYEADRKKYDGVLLLTAANGVGVDRFYCDMAKSSGLPTVIADIPHAGSGAFLKAQSRIMAENLPVPAVSSLNLYDVADTVALFPVIKKMAESRLLIITDDRDAYAEDAREASKIWGCSFVFLNRESLSQAYQTVSDRDARRLADRWIGECLQVQEPTHEDVFNSAKLYFALQNLKSETEADGVIFGGEISGCAGDIPAHPCMAFFEMSRNGEIGVKDGGVNAAVTELVLLHAAGRTGFVAAQVADMSGGQIFYDSCACGNRIFGAGDERVAPYRLRNCAEDHAGVCPQVILPAGEKITAVKLCGGTAALHTAVTVGNMDCESGPRTKPAAKTNIKNILKNWNDEAFGWHRAVVFGDYRKQLAQLCRLKGIRLTEEDL